MLPNVSGKDESVTDGREGSVIATIRGCVTIITVEAFAEPDVSVFKDLGIEEDSKLVTQI
jgi:predicted glycosyltransferase